MSAAPSIGALTDRVQWARRVETAEPGAGTVQDFMPMATLWARVRALGLRQTRFGDGSGSEASHSVVLRYRSDIAPGDRLTYRGRRLEVLGREDPDGRRAWLACRCIEREFVG